jgi:dCMP deaminase
MKAKRVDIDEYFMKMVHLVAERSTCLRRKVGAVIVKDKHVLSTGYNGAPKGLKHCAEVGCVRKQLKIPPGERHELCRGVHAEQNAIIQAAFFGVSVGGATLYTTYHPCGVCAKMLINAGIVEIVYEKGYVDDLARTVLSESRLKVRKIRK